MYVTLSRETYFLFHLKSANVFLYVYILNTIKRLNISDTVYENDGCFGGRGAGGVTQ